MSPDIETALRDCPNLPSLSGVAVQIVEMGQDPDVGIAEVAAVLGTALTMVERELSTTCP